LSRERSSIPYVVGYDDPEVVVNAVSKAKVVVGIPSKDVAHTIAYVIHNVAKGLTKYFSGVDSVIVVSDGLSSDGTKDVVKVIRDYISVPTYILPNVRAPGKGSAIRLLVELVSNYSDADALILLDSDLRSITPEWVAQLINGAMDYGFVAPKYLRDRYDATITNFIARPLTSATYGIDISQPIGGDFGLCKSLVNELARSELWVSNPWVSLFGVDIFITHTALAKGFKVCEANLGVKIHEAKDPSKALKNMFVEVVGSLITLLAEYSDYWVRREVRKLIKPPVINEPQVPPMKPWGIKVSTEGVIKSFREGLRMYLSTYEHVLNRELLNYIINELISKGLDREVWFRVIVEYIGSFLRRQSIGYRTELLKSLIPLWMGRLLNYINEVKGLSDDEVQEVLNEEVMTFVKGRNLLREVIKKYA